jgi:hypothetical protein
MFMVVDKKIHHDSIDDTEAAMVEFFQHVIATAPSLVEQYVIYILYTICTICTLLFLEEGCTHGKASSKNGKS